MKMKKSAIRYKAIRHFFSNLPPGFFLPITSRGNLTVKAEVIWSHEDWRLRVEIISCYKGKPVKLADIAGSVYDSAGETLTFYTEGPFCRYFHNWRDPWDDWDEGYSSGNPEGYREDFHSDG